MHIIMYMIIEYGKNIFEIQSMWEPYPNEIFSDAFQMIMISIECSHFVRFIIFLYHSIWITIESIERQTQTNNKEKHNLHHPIVK